MNAFSFAPREREYAQQAVEWAKTHGYRPIEYDWGDGLGLRKPTQWECANYAWCLETGLCLIHFIDANEKNGDDTKPYVALLERINEHIARLYFAQGRA